MIKTFVYGNFKLDYVLIYSKRKSMSITVHPNMKVVVRVPDVASNYEIDKFLKAKYTWLNNKLEFYKEFKSNSLEKKYVSGSDVLLLGKQYKILVQNSDVESIYKDGNSLILKTKYDINDSSYNLKLLNKFYEKEAEKIFKRRFKACLKQFDNEELKGISFKIRKMNKRWGSYQPSKHNILLNTELIKADRVCIDYIIIHELCHVFHQKHNRAFYDLLSKKSPNYKELEIKLELRFIGYMDF